MEAPSSFSEEKGKTGRWEGGGRGKREREEKEKASQAWITDRDGNREAAAA